MKCSSTPPVVIFDRFDICIDEDMELLKMLLM